jgi:hypothetical protein
MLPVISSFSIWDWSQIVGTAMVLIGVSGELFLLVKKYPFNPTNFSPLEPSKRKLEIISVVILLVGLMLELIALPHSLLEAARLNNENLKLEKQVLGLEAKLQWRTISPGASKHIINLLSTSPKNGIVRISCQGTDLEACNFAKQIYEVLTNCNFKTDFAPALSLFSNGETPAGVLVYMKDQSFPASQGVSIIEAFIAAGLPIGPGLNPDLPDTNSVSIFVGTKPTVP